MSKVFRETLEGAVRLDGWLSGPKPILPQVVVPNYAEWILGVDDFGTGVSGPALILINVGLTAIPEEIQKGLANLAIKEDAVVWVHIRTSDNHEIRQAFVRQVSDSRMANYMQTIPELAGAIEALV